MIKASGYCLDGSSWRRHVLGGHGRCTSISGTGADDIWCAGEFATVAHFDGKEWSRVAAPRYEADVVRGLEGIYATKRHV
jgi:hypothetical protein